MFIFLGDSQPLGYELGDETGEGSEFIPQHAREKVYMDYDICDQCRPDLAYPHLLSESLSQDYVNIGEGGTGHIKHLYNFQKYLKSNHVPEGSTVFLNSNSRLRGFLIDAFTFEEFNFMDTTYFNPFRQPGTDKSSFEEWLNSESNKNIVDMYTRILPYQNYQSVNHISALCKSLGLKFVYFPVTTEIYEDIATGSDRFLNLSREELMLDLHPEFKTIRASHGGKTWLEYHPNCHGHQLIADSLKNFLTNT